MKTFTMTKLIFCDIINLSLELFVLLGIVRPIQRRFNVIEITTFVREI